MTTVTLYPASTTAPGSPSVFYRKKPSTATANGVSKCRTRFRPKTLRAALVEEARPRSLPPARGNSNGNSTNGALPEANSGVSSIVPLSRNRADDIQAESKALARAVNASVYSPELLKFKYASRPFKVIRRTLQILVGLGSFGLKLWIDQFQGQLEQNRRSRAVELRETFTSLGPTFVKIGQGLSTRPDLCPPEFLEELSELQRCAKDRREQLEIIICKIWFSCFSAHSRFLRILHASLEYPMSAMDLHVQTDSGIKGGSQFFKNRSGRWFCLGEQKDAYAAIGAQRSDLKELQSLMI